MISLYAALAIVLFILVFAGRAIVYNYRHEGPAKGRPLHKDGLLEGGKIQPRFDFDWKTVQPIQFRPFKPIYYITMALKSTTPSDLIIIDTNYLSRIRERERIMTEQASHVLGCIPEGIEVVREVYSYLLGEYLPVRYPSLFSRDEKTCHNHATDVRLPLDPPEDPIAALSALGRTVEDDMFLLRETADGHQCIAFLCCFPSGFDPAEKLGKNLQAIHGPVPSYDKIGSSMERFFSRLEVGKNSCRTNWSITTGGELFNLGSNHVKAGDEIEENNDVNIEQARVRTELQTLMRLPKTKAIMFSFKTYQYPIKDLKAEGLGLDLADAIEGLKAGNAPGMWTYKGGVRWGKSVCDFLRAE